MLHALPIPNKDELFYSLVARFVWRLGIQESSHISYLIYGERIARRFVIPDLPRQLDQFQARVPEAHPLSKSDLVQQHTLFPIYSPFLPPDRAQALAAFMRSTPEGPEVLPMPRSINRNPDGGLRVCPRCLREDLKQTGEPWWRRAHNVPGILVCAKHRVFLVSTRIAATSAEATGTYLLPPSASGDVEELCPNDRAHSDMLLLAQHAQWLLDQSDWRVEPGTWVRAYRSKLAGLGYREGVQGNNFRKAAREFEKRFPTDLLSRIGLPTHIAHHVDDWFWRLITYENQIHPPLRHLLFWVWLDLAPGQIKDHLISMDSPKPHTVIGALETRPALQTENGQERLKFLWFQPTVTFRTICAELEADYSTVQRHAKKMHLPFPRPIKGRLVRRFSHVYLKRKAEKLKERKRKWLELCAKHPTLSRAQLRAKNQTLYGALYNSDPEWLKHHVPERKRGSSGNRADWVARDKILLDRLQARLDQIKGSTEFPCRISADAFERGIPGVKLYAYRLKRMPLSAKFIKSVAESAMAYCMRCVSYAAKQLRAEGKSLTPQELRVRAKILPNRATVPEVKALINELCSDLANRSPW